MLGIQQTLLSTGYDRVDVLFDMEVSDVTGCANSVYSMTTSSLLISSVSVRIHHECPQACSWDH